MAFQVGQVEATVGANTRPFERSMDNVKRMGVAAVAAIGASFAAIGGLAIKRAAEFEMLEIRLNTLTGSAEEGAKAFQRLKEFSAGTPFQLNDLVKANNILIGMGASTEDAFNNLQILGDVASATGANVNDLAITFGQASAEGKLMTRDIREFINRGVPLTKLLAESMGVAKSEIFDLASQSKITFDVLQKALKDATTGTGIYANATEKAADSIRGRFSTMTDNTGMLLAEIGELATEGLHLKDVMTSVSDSMKTATKFVSEMEISTEALQQELRGLKRLFMELPGAIHLVTQNLEGVTKAIRDFYEVNQFTAAIRGIRSFLGWMGQTSEEAENLKGSLSFLTEFGDIFLPIIKGAEDTSDAVKEVKKPFVEVKKPIDDMNIALFNANRELSKMMNLPSQDIMPLDPAEMSVATAGLESIVNRLETTDFTHRLSDGMKEVSESAKLFSRTLADGLDAVIFRAKSLQDALSGIIRQLASRALTAGIFSLFGVGGGFASNFFGGFRASGGSVSTGKSYMVGEKGPEMFTPNRSGSIIPNGASMSGGNVAGAIDAVFAKYTKTLSPNEFLVFSREGERLEGRLL